MTETINFEAITQLPDQIDQVLVPNFEDYEIGDFWVSQEVIQGFTGKQKEHYTVIANEQKRTIIFLGLGDEKQSAGTHAFFRNLILTQKARIKPRLLVDLRHLPQSIIYQTVLGISLADYALGLYKSDYQNENNLKQVQLLVTSDSPESNEQITEAAYTAATLKSVCTLVDAPGNIKTPQYLGHWAKESGKANGYKVEVLDQEQLNEQNLHALLAVGRGSEHPSILIKATYKHPEADPSKVHLGLVGKGITFDTGGLSLKKATNMHYMKSDMGGAAAVLGAIELIAKLRLPINVIGFIPVAENSVDSLSIRPGDVIQSHAGKSIEVIDTDAEGRLILADALSYIQQEHKPEYLVDLATLTGSCVAALGYAAAGLFANDDELANSISQSGERTNEFVWRLPLWESYQDALYSDIADVKNLSGKPVAGAITAAKFLEYFVKDHQRWAHLDIAGVAFGDSDHSKMKSATGYGVRLLVDFALQLISK